MVLCSEVKVVEPSWIVVLCGEVTVSHCVMSSVGWLVGSEVELHYTSA